MTGTQISVTPFDPVAAPEHRKLAVGQLLAGAYAFAYPDDPPTVPEQQARELAHHDLTDETAQFVVWDGERALGWANLVFDTVSNLHLAYAILIVRPEERRLGLGRALASALEAVARREGRTTVMFSTTSRVPAGEDFAASLKAEPALPNRQSRLDLGQLDQGLLRDWQRRPAGDPYQLRCWTTIPDEYLARAADIIMVMNTAPRGELDMDDWTLTPEELPAREGRLAETGEVRIALAAEDTRTGQLVGYTETYWGPERAALVYQGSTVVRPEARGQGLGKWLKAAMLAQLPARCPGACWVQTNNADANAAMLSINVALGFKPFAQVTEWQLRLPAEAGGSEESGS